MTVKTLSALSLTAALLAGTAAGAATPADQLVMGWNIDAISTFDPAEINEIVPMEMLRNMCDPLVAISSQDEAKIVPALAESWTVSDDNKVITFKIRKGAQFASGNPVTAHDVEWSYKRMLTLGLSGSSFMKDFGFSKENMDEAFKALDDETFQITQQGQYPVSLVLMSVVGDRAGMVLDSKFLADKAEGDDLANAYLKTKTACAGPYHLRQWQAGEVVLLERNDNWWGEAPAMRRIVIRHVPEAGAQRLLLEKGDIDVARTIVAADIPAYEAHPDTRLERALRPTQQYIAFNTARAPFDNPKTIEAIRYLIDYKGLEETALKNLGVQRNVLVPFGNFGALSMEEGRAYQLDLDKAKALLDEAGVKPGFETTIYLANEPISNVIAQNLAGNAAKVGVTFKIEQMATADLFGRFRGREFDAITSTWSSPMPDAHGLVSRFVQNPGNSAEAANSGYPTWRASWIDDSLNAQAAAALAETDSEKREAMYHAIQREHLTRSPFVYMFQLQQNIAVRKEVTALPNHGFGVYYGEIRK